MSKDDLPTGRGSRVSNSQRTLRSRPNDVRRVWLEVEVARHRTDHDPGIVLLLAAT